MNVVHMRHMLTMAAMISAFGFIAAVTLGMF